MSQHRSTAAQFFLDNEDEEMPDARRSGGGQAGSRHFPGTSPRAAKLDEQNDYEEEVEVAELLTRATVTSNDHSKLEMLRRVTEIIVVKQPALMDNFLDEMLNFQSDSSPEVRQYLLEFIERACDADPETIPKILQNITLMLTDPSVAVQKRAIQATTKIYMTALSWLCRSKAVTEEMENAWAAVNELKRRILSLIDSDNDGIRTHTVKFMEIIILVQTPSENDSAMPSEFCLDQVPITVKVARPRKLEEDAKQLFEELLKFHGSRHATSVNLMACMGSISLIAKLRPSFMGKVITAMEKLNAILPPTLERSQVSSVRKHMKTQLISLLKHPRAVNYCESITNLLTDLGATNSELQRLVPNWDEIRAERRKRQRMLAEEESSNRKRAKLQVEEKPPDKLAELLDDDEEEDDDDDDRDELAKKTDVIMTEDSGGDELERSIFKTLSNVQTAVDLVVASMDRLPDTLPAHFTSSFTPIDIAGTDSQVRHLSRLLAAQITAFQLGPAAALQSGIAETAPAEPSQIPSLVPGTANTAAATTIITPPFPRVPGQPYLQGQQQLPVAPPGKRKIPKALKLSEVTKPLGVPERDKYLLDAVGRILEGDHPLAESKSRLLASILINAPFNPRYQAMQFLSEDIKSRLELGIHWLFAEYASWQGYLSKTIPVMNDSGRDRYEWTFFNLMKAILDMGKDSEKSSLAWRLYTEPPHIPDKGITLLRTLCSIPAHAGKAMELLLELARKRPRAAALHYLSVLLEFSSHAIEEIRDEAVAAVMKMYEEESYRKIIEEQAIELYLKSLRLPQPPENLFGEDLGRKEMMAEEMREWNENAVKASLQLYFQLLTQNHHFVHELAKVYVDAGGDVKRVILRVVETPIRKLGIDSPELMKLIESFPKGAETLMTRILHILTDKTPPTPALVASVRNIYSKRVGDVRFLIPVLTGLSKSDIIAALPKLIKLNPVVVKEVFNRLLGIQTSDSERTQHASPISPVDLMVALHNIEPSKCDVKTVIKATSYCFNESDVFTAEVLAVVINQLLEQSPLPTLLMRTVIQTLALHQKLHGFVMNTLSRLVGKQVWNQPKIWEGFIKCCQRTLPKSIPVLLTLPPEQLKQALTKDAPDLRRPLIDHLMTFSEQQRSCMPPALLSAVFGSGPKTELGVKSEYRYDDYDSEVQEIGERRRGSGAGFLLIKDERRSSPNSGNDGRIKDEPLDYND